MPVTHLLDTSVYSQPIRRTPVQTAIDRWQALGDTALVTCAICEAEILFGIQNEKRKNTSTKIGERYEAVLRGRFDVLPVDAAVAATYAELRCDCEANGRQVPAMDLLIASVARAHNLIIATLNSNDFHAIPGVTIDRTNSLPPPNSSATPSATRNSTKSPTTTPTPTAGPTASSRATASSS